MILDEISFSLLPRFLTKRVQSKVLQIDCDRIRSVNDERLLFLHRIVEWLDFREAMGDKQRTGQMTREIMFALRHILKTMILLCKFLMEKLFMNCLSKLQTDKLEYRFAQYRRLSGNTNINI